MRLRLKFINRNSKLKKFKICNSHTGFTLIELMITMSITILALAVVYMSFVVQQRSFTVQDQVAETDTTSKIAFNILVNDIRDTGFGFPSEESPSINTYTNCVTRGAGTGNSDNLTLVGGFRALAYLALTAAQLTAGQSTVTIGRNFIDICYTSTPTFDTANKRYISIDGVTYAEITAIQDGVADCSIFSDIDDNPVRLLIDRDIDKAFPVNSARPTPVYLVEDVTYGIDLDLESPGELQRSGRVGMPNETITVAENIDDFQVAEIDQDGDGNIDRMRINILARTTREDPNLDTATKAYAGGITMEDGSAIGAGDRFRRRIWSMEVALRNPEG